VEVRLDAAHDTVWLTQRQMADLFETSTDNVSLHLKNVYESGELGEDATTEDSSVVRREGNRNVTRKVRHYNLDAIISVGYRVISKRAVLFRQWATRVIGYKFVVSGAKPTVPTVVTMVFQKEPAIWALQRVGIRIRDVAQINVDANAHEIQLFIITLPVRAYPAALPAVRANEAGRHLSGASLLVLALIASSSLAGCATQGSTASARSRAV
jgi:Virulence protein RhuM family